MMGRRLEYEVKTSVRLNMSNPQHVKINDVIQNLDPKIFKSKNQFIIDAIQFYIDNYGKETFVIKKKEKERAEYIRSEDIDDIKEEVIEAAIEKTSTADNKIILIFFIVITHPFSARGTGFVFRAIHPCSELFICNARDT
jgi:hypothetical protein